MDTHAEGSRTVNARSLLLPYALTLIAAMTIIQIIVAVTGGDISLLAMMLTGVVAIGIVVWLLRTHRRLSHVRFGVVIAHAIAFVTITASFNIHATIRTISLGSGADGFQAAALNLLATPWFGATLVMSSAWGIGLLTHLLGTVLGRGWED